MTRLKRALVNSASMIVYEMAGIVCAFIVPRLILSYYGSGTNGLILSITRFLSISTIMDAGIGSVVRAALYKPLATHDNQALSEICASTRAMYRKISVVFAIYAVLIACVIPFVNSDGFDFWFVFQLTVITATSTFFQFVLGSTNSTVINADQRAYVIVNVNTVTLIGNTVAIALLMRLGFGIREIKLVTCVFFIIRPIYANAYCRKHYQIGRRIKTVSDPIKQKRDGFGHQIANAVHDNYDVILLTIITTYNTISVYSVYALVTEGLTKLLGCLNVGIGPSFGNMLITDKRDSIVQKFEAYNTVSNIVSSVLFGCAMALIQPFVSIYTANITDTNYVQPTFGALLILSSLMKSIKGPYNIVIFAAGHFKKTKISAYIEMSIHILISSILVNQYGLTGVALGAICAMLYRATYCALYIKKNILCYPIRYYIINLMLNAIVIIGTWIVSRLWVNNAPLSYAEWLLDALPTVIIAATMAVILYGAVYRKTFRILQGYLRVWKK